MNACTKTNGLLSHTKLGPCLNAPRIFYYIYTSSPTVAAICSGYANPQNVPRFLANSPFFIVLSHAFWDPRFDSNQHGYGGGVEHILLWQSGYTASRATAENFARGPFQILLIQRIKGPCTRPWREFPMIYELDPHPFCRTLSQLRAQKNEGQVWSSFFQP